MKENKSWSRRKFSKALLSLQALVATGAYSITSGCKSDGSRSEDGILGKIGRQRLQLAMDEIIPRSGNMPSASEVDGISYILNVLDGYPNLLDAFNEMMINLNDLSNTAKNHDFENLESDSRILVLKRYEQEQPEKFSVLVNFVYESYYINEKVWELIGYEPYPTMSAGPKMKPFDEAMLERVKRMSSTYFKV